METDGKRIDKEARSESEGLEPSPSHSAPREGFDFSDLAAKWVPDEVFDEIVENQRRIFAGDWDF